MLDPTEDREYARSPKISLLSSESGVPDRAERDMHALIIQLPV